MVPPTLFISGGVAVLQLCKEVYVRFQYVKRFREDCRKLAYFVHRIEALITETEDDADMTAPGWEDAFGALHESLLEVVKVFDDCTRYGLLRSLINADELNLRWSAIAQRLMLALQLLPIQKAKVTDKRLAELKALQTEIRAATFVAVRAAEEQSAVLKKLMDQSRVDSSKTQEMLAQVLLLLQTDSAARYSGADADAELSCEDGVLRIDPAQLEAEVADLHAERERMVIAKKAAEEEYLNQVIAAITAMEAALQSQGAMQAALECTEEVPPDLRCPITYQLLRDPVILVDNGQTYDRAAIQEWIDRGNTKDPVSGVHLQSAQLVPNILVRKLAEEWLETHPDYGRQAAAEASAAAESAQPAGASCKPREVCSKAAAAAAAVVKSHKIQVEHRRSSQTGSAEPCPADSPEDLLSVHPKTAAILEAGSTLDPGQRSMAQQAYAAVVAAAAAADQKALRFASGAEMPEECSPHAGSSSYAADANAAASAAAAMLGAGSGDAMTGWQATAEATYAMESATAGSQPAHDPAQARQFPSEITAAALSQPGSRNLQWQLQQQNNDTMNQLQTTLSRAAEQRYRMTMRDRPQDVATETVRLQRQQQRQQQAETAYLQHMEQLLRSQAGPQVPRPRSSSGLPDVHVSRDQCSSAAGPSSSCAIPGRTHRSSHDLPPRSGSPSAGSCASAPSGPSFDAHLRQQQQQQQQQQLPPCARDCSRNSLEATSVSSEPVGRSVRKGSWSSSFSLGRRPSRKTSSEQDTVSVAASMGEDTASVTSNDSKRSMSKSVLGMLKKVQYTMVYNEDHC